MSKYMKICFTAFVLAVLCWWIGIVLSPSGLELILPILAVTFSLIFLCFLVISIVQKANASVSPYRVFAVTDGIIGAGVLAYAIYDIKTDTGWFSGLLGALLLIIVIPVILILLITDFFIWLYKKKKQDK